jgi:hypothetical protein
MCGSSAAAKRSAARKAGRPLDAAKRRAIIDTAAHLFFHNGYAATAIEQVAADAGVSKVTIYNQFGDKRALFIAAVSAPFLSGVHPAWWPFAIWGIVVGLGIGLWSLWVLLLQWPPLRNGYERYAGLLDGIFGLVLAALAIRLMVGW